MENVKVKFSLNWAFIFAMLGGLILWMLGLVLVIEAHFHSAQIYEFCQRLAGAIR